MGRTYGYLEFKTEENIETQIHIMFEYFRHGIKKDDIFIDKITKRNYSKSSYNKLKDIIKEDDTIVIKNLNHLGRIMYERKMEYKYFVDNNINIIVLDNPACSISNDKTEFEKKLTIDIVLEMLSYFTPIDDKARNNQRIGIEKAKENGIHMGRPRATYPDNWESVYERYKKKELTAIQAFSMLDIKKSTFYNLVNRYENRY